MAHVNRKSAILTHVLIGLQVSARAQGVAIVSFLPAGLDSGSLAHRRSLTIPNCCVILLSSLVAVGIALTTVMELYCSQKR
jgi:ABC-type uncharacterized transport system permease subunit